MNVANIDNLGNVHPDTFWWDYTLGNVRTRQFPDIWRDTSDPLMAGLKARPRKIGGRCGECRFFADLRRQHARARMAARPATRGPRIPRCYLDDDELGIAPGRERVALTPYRRVRRPQQPAQ